MDDELLGTRSSSPTRWTPINTPKPKEPLLAAKPPPALMSEKSSEILSDKSVGGTLNAFHVGKEIGVFTGILNSELTAIHRRLDEQNDRIIKDLKECMAAAKTHGGFRTLSQCSRRCRLPRNELRRSRGLCVTEKYRSRLMKCKKALESVPNLATPREENLNKKRLSSYLNSWKEMSLKFLQEIAAFDTSSDHMKNNVRA